MRRYHDIPVTIVAQGETEEEARINAALFMPWIGAGTWSPQGHEFLLHNSIDCWFMPGVDSTELEGKLRELGFR